MKILLFGHDGQVGWELDRRLGALGTVRGFSYPAVDFADPDALRRLVRAEAPGLIVNAAAYTAVDSAEAEPETARLVNAVGPGVLAEEAQRLGVAIVHYSTDYVFDGDKAEPYRETDAPNPLGVYGQTKLDGDRAVQAAAKRHLIFRVSWVYGRRGRNFLLTIRRLVRERGGARIVSDQVGSPTWCGAIAGATVAALDVVRGAGWDWPRFGGLYHMTCAGATSWHGFARAFLPRTAAVTPIATGEYPTRARRPRYSVLDGSRLREVFGLQMPSWTSALRECLLSEPDPEFADASVLTE